MKRALLALLLAACERAAAPRTCEPRPAAAASARPGARGPGAAVLPNGRGVAPAGQRLSFGQGPLHLALSPDGALLATAEFGVNLRGVSLLSVPPGADLALRQRLGEWSWETQRNENAAFLRGLAWSADSKTLYAANTGADRIDVFVRGGDGRFAAAAPIPVQGSWPADLALSGDGAVLFVTVALARRIQAYSTATGALLAQAPTPGSFPHAMLHDGARLFVASFGSDSGQRYFVSAHAASDLKLLGTWPVGKNPAALALSPDKRTLYVAASDDDFIDRIDLTGERQPQPIMLEPPGGRANGLSISPGALALSPDGRTLYVAASLLGAVLVVDAATGATRGAIPAGWRPSAVLLADGGRTLYVANAKGLSSVPSPDPVTDNSTPPRGLLQRISPIPEGEALAAATEQVAALNAMPAREFEPPDPDCERIGPLPARRGQDPAASRIKHVIMVLKENKTFDAVFGDFPGAEASRDFLLFGAEITPNQHKLAHEFCLLDNFLLESEQSVEGHYWMTAQVTTEYFERIWAGPWAGGVKSMPLPPGGLSPLDTPRDGFIWDQFARAHVPYRSWGEFVGVNGDLANRNIDLDFVDNPANFLARPDTEKLEVFLAVLRNGKLPAFSFVALQWDHTYGKRAGFPAPEYMVADNDLATGRLVEAVSRSPYWKDTLILITEDDPAGSADHVDAHRSFALVVSPWARRGRVSHVRGSMPSLAATWQRALGVPPSSTFDANAEPLWDCLTGVPDERPFTALPSNVAPRTNRRGDPGEEESRGLDFSAVDKAVLGPALWKAMRPGEPMPGMQRR